MNQGLTVRKNNIELVNVTKEYSTGHSVRKCALKEVTLTIYQGEFVGLLGRNGSGKSTLARLINGLVYPTEGKVLVKGMDTTDRHCLMEIRRQVGMVFQNPDNQIVSSIVEEDVAFGPENLGLSPAEIKERVDWALQAVGLEHLRRHAPHLLSGGQKQAVAIASALAMRPAHLILDEPTSMLDPGARDHLLDSLRTLNEKYGLTVILISHNGEDLVQARRLLVLEEGSVYLEGTPAEVFTARGKLAAIGLKPPDIIQLISNLRVRGYIIDQNIVTLGQLVDYLCQS